jgi:hypothetical protein
MLSHEVLFDEKSTILVFYKYTRNSFVFDGKNTPKI